MQNSLPKKNNENNNNSKKLDAKLKEAPIIVRGKRKSTYGCKILAKHLIAQSKEITKKNKTHSSQ